MKRFAGLVLCVWGILGIAIPLRAEDKSAAFGPPPKGFDVRREGVKSGKVKAIEFESKVANAKRKMTVYTPPGYSADVKYPVLYLLHGGGDNETTWSNPKQGAADAILDNLLDEKKVVPMVVVMPRSSARKGDGPTIDGFEEELLKDVIPYVEANYSVRTDAESRGIAGLSLGGRQALAFGLKHPDRFAWVAGMSSAIRGKQPEVISSPADAAKKLRLLWVSCGEKDTLKESAVAFHTLLEEKKVPHVWRLSPGIHEWPTWRDDLYWLTPMLFREKK